MIKVLAWLWQQTPPRHDFNADKVNQWYYRAREAITVHGVSFACVTNVPEGLDPGLEVIPLPDEFSNVRIDGWKERQGAPQCYRRLSMWAPNAAEYFGAEWLFSTDVDATYHGGPGSCNHLLTLDAELRIFNGTASKRPYNGGLVLLRAGSRPQVYEKFAADPVGVATAARKRFVGSDQAVISHILGPGERTWGPDDGVYYFSPRFVRENGGSRCRPPRNLCLMFYPGNVKPWNHEVKRFPWINAAWNGLSSPVQPEKLRLRAYRDPKGWGTEFAKAATERGHFCSLFSTARVTPHGLAFVRLDQQGRQRETSKRIVADLNRAGVRTLPTAREAIWYDDKGAQMEALGRWMPHTVMFRDRKAATEYAATACYPIVSKSIDGAGSKGVRLLANKGAALAEIRSVFSPRGIPSVYHRRQAGYVYWQEFVAGNPRDYRVCVVGGYFYGLVRENAPGSFKASGSGVFRTLELADERELAAARLAVEIADALQTQWMAFDIVFDGDAPLVLEMSSAWTMSAYASARCFTRDGFERTGRTGAESFAIAVEVMEGMWRQTR